MGARFFDVFNDNAQDIGRANVRGPAAAHGLAGVIDRAERAQQQPKAAVVRNPLDGHGTGEFGGGTVALRQPRNGVCRMRVADRFQRIECATTARSLGGRRSTNRLTGELNAICTAPFINW
jgi:hypothetical protein